MLRSDFFLDEFQAEGSLYEYDEERDENFVVEGFWELSPEGDVGLKVPYEVEFWMPLPTQPLPTQLKPPPKEK